VPHVLHRCLKLRQHEGACPEEASELEALEIDEGARLDRLGIGGGKHGAALLVHEHVVPIA
jgi:hypothetical protein